MPHSTKVVSVSQKSDSLSHAVRLSESEIVDSVSRRIRLSETDFVRNLSHRGSFPAQ